MIHTLTLLYLATVAILEISVIPLSVTHRHVVLTSFVSLYTQRVQKPLQRTFFAVCSTKHCLRLVQRLRTTS